MPARRHLASGKNPEQAISPGTAELGRVLRGLDDDDHVAGESELGPGEEHAADPSAPGLRPRQPASVIVGETPAQDLLPAGSI
jgi:hypothetical protein